MTCKRAIRQLSEYLDGELDAGLIHELEQHLAQCHDCRIIVETTRKTIEMYSKCEPLPLPQSAHEGLMLSLAGRFTEDR